jgi:hypothetical protein
MDPARKERRIGSVSVIAVLVVVCAFWLVFVPRSKRHGSYKEERELKQMLQAIQPPAGAKATNISAIHFEDMHVIAVGAYLTDSTNEMVKAHYMQEFPRHAFVFKGENNKKESQTSLNFCSPSYMAELVFSQAESRPMTYTIFLHRQGTPC